VPIYDYVCGSCGHRFEVIRGINEAGPHQCPECGGPVARAFVPPTIHFKGTGWAKSDRRATSAPTRRADSGSASPGSSKSPADGASGPPSGTPGGSPDSGVQGSTGESKPAESGSTENDG
jgi:putative FmdB family regulatory protein